MSENFFMGGSEEEDVEENSLIITFFCGTLKLFNVIQKNQITDFFFFSDSTVMF